ncbi:MAG TPA: TIGR03118 family protein [Polyangia bacterium]|jgi:uncharacterized protein (TIGR03118 family)|nr:TIGR03118 family protein [Polyangia bacterium]
MKIREVTGLLSILVLGLSVGAGCSSSSTPANDGATDGTKSDTAADTAKDVANDTATDMANDVATDAPTDQVTTVDAANGGADAPGTTTQALALTVIVTDQIGGDGGLEVGPSDAGATEAGTDGGDDGASDGPAGITIDPNLVNPWGLAFNPSGPLWVADNHSGLSTVYSATGEILPVVVTVPVPADGGMPPSAPTGLVFNGSATTFMGDKFIFSSEDGTISGWQTGTAAALRADNSPADAIYKGLALATSGGASHLFATDFHNGKIDVFDESYAKVVPAGGFTDATIPAGFAPFGVQAIADAIWVTYAQQDDMKEDDMPGPGNGYVDVFDFDGHFVRRAISQGALNSPWALVVAPADFGAFSGALLVGNFGDGHINAYNQATGALLGGALDTAGAPLKIDGLWALVFGNDSTGAPHTRLYFTAGPKMESHGLLGYLDVR